MVLIDQGKSEVVTAPVIRAATTGGRAPVSGLAVFLDGPRGIKENA